MAITAPGMAPGCGTEPGLHAVWRLVSVDPSADQFGISALSRGQPCGRQILPLLVEIDRLACRCVVDVQGFRTGDPTVRAPRTGARETARHTQGEGAGDPRGRPFLLDSRTSHHYKPLGSRTNWDWSSGRPSKEIARTR